MQFAEWPTSRIMHRATDRLRRCELVFIFVCAARVAAFDINMNVKGILDDVMIKMEQDDTPPPPPKVRRGESAVLMSSPKPQSKFPLGRRRLHASTTAPA